MTDRYTDEQIQKNRDDWLEALESGRYKKGTKVLCKNPSDNTPKRFCCLGVAAEIFKEEGTKLTVTKEGWMVYDVDYELAPDYVVNKLGLHDKKGGSSDNESIYVNDHLARINDISSTFEPVIKAIRTGLYWKPLGETS